MYCQIFQILESGSYIQNYCFSSVTYFVLRQIGRVLIGRVQDVGACCTGGDRCVSLVTDTAKGREGLLNALNTVST